MFFFRIVQLLLQDEPNEITEPEPEPEMEVEEAPKFDMCKHPYKDWEKSMPQSQKLSLVMVGRMIRLAARNVAHLRCARCVMQAMGIAT